MDSQTLHSTDFMKRQAKPKLKRFLIKNGPPYALLLVPLICFAIFSIYPILWAAKYVFYAYDGFNAHYVGLLNFKRLGTDQLYWQSLGKQAAFSLKTLLELPLAFVLALILHSKIRGRNFFRGVFLLPHIVPGATMALVFYILLNPYNGAVNHILLTLGIVHQPVMFLSDGLLAFLSGMAIDAWQFFGVNMLFFLVGLSSIPDEVFESASIDGVTYFQRIWYITLPMMGRILQIIIFLSVLGSLKGMGPFLVLTDGGPNYATEVTFLYIFHKFFADSGRDFGYGAALAVVTACFLLLLSLAYFKLSKRMDYN